MRHSQLNPGGVSGLTLVAALQHASGFLPEKVSKVEVGGDLLASNTGAPLLPEGIHGGDQAALSQATSQTAQLTLVLLNTGKKIISSHKL